MLLRAIPISAWTAALVAATVGYAGTATLLVQSMRTLGANQIQIGSALTALCIGIALGGSLLSFRSRTPVVLAWSTPGAALLAAVPAGMPWHVAVGVFISASLMMLVFAVVPALGRLTGRFPPAIAAGVLAGVLLPFCLDLFQVAAVQPILVALLLAVFIFARQRLRTLALLLVLIAGIALTAIGDGLGRFDAPMLVGVLSPTVPSFDLSAIASLGIPLFLVTLVSQNLPGMAVLRAAGYDPKPRTLFIGTGLASLLTAPFGGHGVNLAAITAAICTGDEAHPDPNRRWVVAAVYAGIYLLMALFSPALIELFMALPREVIAVLTGLALVPALSGALGTLLTSGKESEAGILAFLATGSGLTLMGLGAAFWGLAVGLLALGARSLLSRSADPSSKGPEVVSAPHAK